MRAGHLDTLAGGAQHNRQAALSRLHAANLGGGQDADALVLEDRPDG